jgi:hypothetical protein
METPATPHNIHDEAEQHDTGVDANFDTNDTDDDTDPLTDPDLLNEEFHAINTLSTTLLLKHHGNPVPHRQPKLTYLTAALT